MGFDRNALMDNLKHSPVQKPASWDEVLRIEPTAREGEYLAEAYPDWTFGGTLHGGIVFALCVEAAKVDCCLHEATRDHVDAISSQLLLLRPSKVGKINLNVYNLKIGAQYSIWRVTASQADSRSRSYKQKAEATIVLGNLDKEASNPTALKLPVSDKPLHVDVAKTRPSREGWQVEHMKERTIPFHSNKNYLCLHPPGQQLESHSRSHPVYGSFVRENWWKADEPWTSAHLPYLLDLGRPMHMNFDEGREYWGPTLSISLDLKKRPPKTAHAFGKESGSEWLFQQVELEEFKDGRLLIHMVLKDEEGDTLAVVKMVNITVPYGGLKSHQASDSRKNKL